MRYSIPMKFIAVLLTAVSLVMAFGGILGVVPGRMGIGVFCPALDEKGNSLCGIKAMEYLSEKLELSIF